MAKFKNKYRIESIRLPGYDYSQPGGYFITIVTHNRECLFGEIENGEMKLNERGKIVQECWVEIPKHFPNVILDTFIIMPNHIHGVIILNELGTNKNILNNQNVETQNFVSLQDRGNKNVETQNFVSLQQQNQNHNEFQKIIPKSIGSIIRGFKIGVTKGFHQNSDHNIVWQRNYYEHVIRNEDDLNQIREYIMNNPNNWEDDENNIKM